MPRGPNRFSQREVSRAIRAVEVLGHTAECVEVDPNTGKISVTIAKPGGEAAEQLTPLEQWRRAKRGQS
jgi:hypothetical protein